MKIVIWKNKDLDEPFEDIPGDTNIIATEDGYVYLENTATDPIEQISREDYQEYWVDENHPEIEI